MGNDRRYVFGIDLDFPFEWALDSLPKVDTDDWSSLEGRLIKPKQIVRNFENQNVPFSLLAIEKV